MIYTQRIEEAIKLAIETHEIDQKQKRKGKDISYITHPMTVGVILSLAKASEDVVIAGILHDTIEDSIEDKKVTEKIISDKFGDNVAKLVLSVTEQDKEATWEERKALTLKNIETFSLDSLLLKSADLTSNASEIISDYNKDGDKMFERFHASKEKTLDSYIKAMEAILKRWPENPLANNLKDLVKKLKLIY